MPDFDDDRPSAGPRWAWFARQPVAWGAFATASAALVVSAARSTVDPQRTLGIGLLIAGVGFVVMAIGSRAWTVAAVGAGVTVCGVFVVADPRRFTTVVAVAGGAVGIAFGVSLILGYRRRNIRPGGIGTDLATNSQIASRITPTLLDLGIAMAAGAAGAYALSRHDVSDSLPGVAGAIALVPPLGVAGVAMQLGQWSAAAGAILLFLTNATAIFGMGALTFVLTGAADVRRYEAGRDGLRVWILGLVAVSVVVLGALLANGASRSLAGFRQDRAEAVVSEWIADRGYSVTSVLVDGDLVVVSLAGTTVPEDTGDLAAALAASFGVPVTVDLQVTLQERVEISSDG